MSAKALIGWTTFAAVTCLQGGCAQVARGGSAGRDVASITADSTQAVRQFVQRFYDWYVPLTIADHAFPAEYYVLDKADSYLDPDLAAALRADSVVEEVDPEAATRETLDFDPFLFSQDPCGPYEVVRVARRGDAFRVGMRPCHADGISPTVEVRAEAGQWKITNLLYGDGDLRTYLCRWAMADLRPEKRPAHCSS